MLGRMLNGDIQMVSFKNINIMDNLRSCHLSGNLVNTDWRRPVGYVVDEENYIDALINSSGHHLLQVRHCFQRLYSSPALYISLFFVGQSGESSEFLISFPPF